MKYTLSLFALVAAVCLANGIMHANTIPLGDAANYAVLYTGTGGHNFSITNVTINGNVGVGGTGVVQFSGPGTINGRLDFSAANTGQFHNTNGSNVGPTSVNYSRGNVTTDLGNLASLSAAYSGGTSIALGNAGATINESSGVLETVDGVTARVFAVSSYSAVNSTVLTINGDGSGDPVVFDFDFNSNVNLSGTVVFGGTGLTSPDQVLYNFQTSGENINLNNNGETAFRGIILGPNDILSMTHAVLDGRFFGGDSGDMQIVSGDTLNAPPPTTQTPEPSSLLMFGSGLLGLAPLLRRCVRSV
jgi:PEP-CTERM motif-containing protein